MGQTIHRECRLPNRKLTTGLRVVLSALSLTLLVVSAAHAAATFGSVLGPTWLYPGYRFTVNLTAMSDPDHDVCLSYTVNGGAPLTGACSCTSPGCTPSTGIGTWVCTIPTNYTNSTIAWNVATYANATCSSLKTAGPSGSFTTGPTAITLSTFSAEGLSVGLFSTAQLGLILLGVLAAFLALLRLNRLRRSA